VEQAAAITAVVDGLRQGKRYQVLRGITASGKTYMMANIIAAMRRPALIVAHNKVLATQLYGEFRGFFPDNAVHYFVSPCTRFLPEGYDAANDRYIDKIGTTDGELTRHRVEAMTSLLERRDVIVVASTSCMFGLVSQEAFRRSLTSLRTGQTIDREQLLSRLADVQYILASRRLRPGTYQVAGNSVKVLSTFAAAATQVDFSQNDIAALLTIDAKTGAPIQRHGTVTIPAAFESVTPRDQLSSGIPRILREARGRISQLRRQGKLLEAQRLEARVRGDTALLRASGYCPGIENYAAALGGGPRGTPTETLLHHLPDDAVLFVDESHRTVPLIRGAHRGDRERKSSLVENGFLLPSASDRRPLTLDEVEAQVGQIVFVSATPGRYELGRAGGSVVEQVIRPTGLLDPVIDVLPSDGAIEHLAEEIRRRKAADERALVTAVTIADAERVTKELQRRGVRCTWLHSGVGTTERAGVVNKLRAGEIDALVGVNLLREGLDLPEVSLVGIFDADREGFLRDEVALIQTIGRCARNVNGTAILYAHTVTRGMMRAIAETRRRRAIQEAHNREHGITPATVRKVVPAARS
jgi:excinuclease ABC subunit B